MRAHACRLDRRPLAVAPGLDTGRPYTSQGAPRWRRSLVYFSWPPAHSLARVYRRRPSQFQQYLLTLVLQSYLLQASHSSTTSPCKQQDVAPNFALVPVDVAEEQDQLDLGPVRSLAVTSLSPLLCWFSVRPLTGRTGCWGVRWERKDSALLRAAPAQRTMAVGYMVVTCDKSRRLLQSIVATF
jgi:hypothetical protein